LVACNTRPLKLRESGNEVAAHDGYY
jgi:hypothetical protein